MPRYKAEIQVTITYETEFDADDENKARSIAQDFNPLVDGNCDETGFYFDVSDLEELEDED